MSTPFNIDLWKAGRKVTTRNGREVTQLTEFKCNGDRLVGVIDGNLSSWGIDGNFINKETNLDLIHPDEEVVVEVDPTYRDPNLVCISNVFHRDILPPGKYKLVKIEE